MGREPSLRLVDVIAALLERDRVDEAVDYQIDALMLSAQYELPVEDILLLTVDEVVELANRPPMPKVPGWDNVRYGDAAFKGGKL